jgi:DNA-binding transcriptional LysR family regulator
MAKPDLSDLDAFMAVAAARSFRAAAKVHGGSASSLGDAVRRLENQLSVRLLNRTTRSVTPTEAGARLMERLAPALGEIASALLTVDRFRDSPTGVLRLNVPTIVALHVLPEIAQRFLKAHPGITLEVVANDNFIDVLAAGFDAGIRYDESLERDMIAVPIGPRQQRYVLAASHRYLEARGIPAHPQDLLDHACLRHRFPSRVISTWEFEKGDEIVKVNVDGPLIATTIEMRLAAAKAGLGILYGFEEIVASALKDGSLVPVLPDWSPSFSGPFLYYPSRNHMPAPLRAFVDFIKRETTT